MQFTLEPKREGMGDFNFSNKLKNKDFETYKGNKVRVKYLLN